MTFLQLYGDQLDIELGSADRSQLFTLAKRKKAVNDAMHNFERITSCTPTYGVISMATGVSEYNLLGALANYISLLDREEPFIKRVNGTSITYIQGDSFVRRTPHWLDVANSGWRADSNGTPTSWYVRNDGGRTFLGVDPPPDLGTETWTLNVPYLANSTDMVADGDQPFTIGGNTFAVLAPYHQALVHYAAGVLEPLRKGYTAAQRQMGLYAGFVTQYETKKRKDGPNQITFRRNYLRGSQSSRPRDPHSWP